MSKEKMVEAIQAMHAGGHRIPPNVDNRMAARMGRPEITPREIEVLKLIVKGKSNKEIRATLDITEDTVKGHLKSFYSKLGVNDRTQAAICALQHGRQALGMTVWRRISRRFVTPLKRGEGNNPIVSVTKKRSQT